MAYNVYVYPVARIGGLENAAQRNVNPGHCPTWVNEIKKLIFNNQPYTPPIA
jgi:hypothetical protein